MGAELSALIRCPDTERYPKDLVGCGSTNVEGPDEEGFYDCTECGLFFKADAIERKFPASMAAPT